MQKTTKKLVGSALLAALAVVLARLMSMVPSESARFSIEAVPIFLSGLFYGPVYGILVGFSSDFIGCLISPFGYNPILCLPPMLYGLAGGLLRLWLGREGLELWKLALSFLLPLVIGSVLWQSFALALTFGKGETLMESYLLFLGSRSIQFALTYGVDLAILLLLCRSKVFVRLGLLPPWRKKAGEKP